MPYASRQEGGKITVYKKDSGEVVGHTTPDKYKAYMAALHMHEPKGYAYGGMVEPDPFEIGIGNSTATIPSLTPPSVPAFPAPKLTMADLKQPNLLDSLSTSPELERTPAPAAFPPAEPSQVPPLPSRAAAPAIAGGAPVPAPNLADILGDAEKAGRSVYGAYTPDKREELVRYMLEKRNSLPNAIGQSLAGLGDAISRGAGRESNMLENLNKRSDESAATALGNFDEMQKSRKAATETGLSLAQMDPSSSVSKSAQTAARPMLAAAGLSDTEIANLPASAIDGALKSATSFADAKAKLAQVAAMKEYNMGTRHDTEQDRLEQQAKQTVSNLRGDRSLARVEEQRDASISAYNLIAKLKEENRMPSKLEYYDLLGQLWKARTGTSPTDQAIRDLDAQTFKGDLGRAATYFSGKPAGATTAAVLDNIQGFAKESGLQADKMHEAYMRPHLVKPTNLDDSRWKPIVEAGRGMSFAEAAKSAQGEAKGNAPDHSAAIQWAQTHADDPRAKLILQRANMFMGAPHGGL